MTYMPLTPVVPSDKAKKTYKYALPTGGIKLSQEQGITELKAAEMLNITPFSTHIESRLDIKKVSDFTFGEGSINGFSKDSFYGKCVFHIGQGLYIVENEHDGFQKLEAVLPDKKSIFCHFMSMLYIYCDTRIFCLDNSFSFSECEPKAPILYENISAYSGTNHKRNDETLNLAAPILGAKYSTTSSSSYRLPIAADDTRPIKVILNDVVLATKEFKLEDNKVVLTNSKLYPDDKDVEIHFYAKNYEDLGYDDTLYRCESVVAFGGDAGGGTRLIFTGDKEKKGSYYKSALQNPLYFPADGEEIVGDGCENVTALMKMYGALIILCENSIYRMDYNLTESGVYFTCKQISCETGCDMPNSVQLIDNRVVFANSKKGIFIIDSMDEAGEHNIKPIGLNVLSGRDMGFLDTEASDKHKACSIDFDRKYCLFIKDRAYIWDYNKVQYSDKYDYSKAAERLVWYVYDGLTQGDAFNLGKNLYFLSKDDNCIYGFFESDSVDFDIKLFSGYMDFGVSTSYKLVDKISLFMSNPNGEQSAIAFYCDGEKYYTAPLASACQKLCKVDVLLPKKRLYRFGFEIRTKSKITIENIEISYKILSK